jgi:hypothetical protein
MRAMREAMEYHVNPYDTSANILEFFLISINSATPLDMGHQLNKPTKGNSHAYNLCKYVSNRNSVRLGCADQLETGGVT